MNFELADKLNLVIAIAELIIMGILLYNELRLFKGRLKNGIALHIFFMAAVSIFDLIYVLIQMNGLGNIIIPIKIIHDSLLLICIFFLSIGELQVLKFNIKHKWLILVLFILPSLAFFASLIPYPNVDYIFIIKDNRLFYNNEKLLYLQSATVLIYRFLSIGFGAYAFFKNKKSDKHLSELGLIFVVFSVLTMVFSFIISFGVNINQAYVNQGFFLSVGLVYLISKLNQFDIKETTSRMVAVETELSMATSIQKNMLPINFNDERSKGKVEIYASMNPAKEVGGDFYDFYWIDNNHLALCIADVSGKGVPAALFMVVAKTIFRNACKTYKKIDEILKTVNEQLCEDNKNSMFVTCWAGILELSTGKLKCANAGHEFPVFARKNNKFELIRDKHGLPLASVDIATYTSYELKLNKGDVLFVYTDGFPEANNENGDMLGEEKMMEILNSRENKDPTKLIESTKEGVKEFIGKADQFDDLTMLSIKML